MYAVLNGPVGCLPLSLQENDEEDSNVDIPTRFELDLPSVSAKPKRDRGCGSVIALKDDPA